jgi:hypothetical protein
MSTAASDVATVIETVVSNIVQKTLIQESILIPAVWDRTAEVRPGMDTLSIPIFPALAIEEVTEGTILTARTITPTVDDLVLSQNEAIHWTISDRADIQAKIDLAVESVKNGARTMTAAIDNVIVGELLKASATTPDHLVQFANTPTDTVQVIDITEARRLLNVQNVPMSDRFLLIPPDQEKAMLNIDNFISTEKYGSNEPIQNGEIGRVFGFKVLMTTSSSLAAASFVAFHREACAYASQIRSKFETDRDIAKLEDQYTLSQLYGAKVLDAGKRTVVFNATGA